MKAIDLERVVVTPAFRLIRPRESR